MARARLARRRAAQMVLLMGRLGLSEVPGARALEYRPRAFGQWRLRAGKYRLADRLAAANDL